MADSTPAASGALPDPSPPPESTDPIISPIQIQRRDTLSSKAASEGASEKLDTCRICRGEGTFDEPLFYPCKCSGSIKFVHQECLMEWLSHSHKKHCELCKTPFRFTKLYDANMPQKLPWRVFAKRACWHVVQLLTRGCRSFLVAFVWLGMIPWLIRWAWRWFFWIADAAWAREAFMETMRSSPASERHALRKVKEALVAGEMGNADWLASTVMQLFNNDAFSVNTNQTDPSLIHTLGNALAKTLGYPALNATSASGSPPVDASVLSSWNYLASLTPDPRLNRVILDVFEGQIITCVVIVGFILVFLIREWVVQQQPLVNLDNLGNVQQQLREAADRVQADNERLRRQQELLEQAQRRLAELQNETETRVAAASEAAEAAAANVEKFAGWDALEQLIDHATEHLRKGGDEERAHFLSAAEEVARQIQAVGSVDMDLDDFTEKVYRKLSGYSDEERKEWESALAAEMEKIPANKRVKAEADGVLGNLSGEHVAEAESSGSSGRRPPMPERDFVSRATQIQRDLEEEDIKANGTPNGNLEHTLEIAEQGATGEPSVAKPERQSDGKIDAEQGPEIRASFDPMPITNAGPDAKINIKVSGKGKMRVVPEPKIVEKMLNDDEKKRKLEDEVTEELKEEKNSSTEQTLSTETAPQDDEGPKASNENNPFHPDGPEPERRNSESFSNRVASVFREEFGLDEAEELNNFRQAGAGGGGPGGETPANDDDNNAENLPPAAQASDDPPGYFQRLADWLWGDIQPQDAQEPALPPDEEVQQQQQQDAADGNNEAPFVPVRDGQPDIATIAAPQPEQPAAHDPEVVAAAQQAGLDAEAIEDAEDLEGIFELIGLQGPLIGLFQTSAFCTLLVACTILCAVILPYFGGKIVLNLLGSPVYFLVKMPLQAANGIADLVIDLTLFIGGGLAMLAASATTFLLYAARAWIPSLGGEGVAGTVYEYANITVTHSGMRLQDLFVTSEPVEGPTVEVLALSWAFLAGSAHAHASLKTIQDNINAVLSFMGAVVTWMVETISFGSVTAVLKQSLKGLTLASLSPARLQGVVESIRQHTQPLVDFISDLARGSLTISSPDVTLDETLVYWNSTDRALAITTGYMALAALAAVYVAVDTPITRSESGRRTEKMIRDTLRQAGGVLKVILIISIEMLVFPLYCGLLLDVAFLPLFKDASLAGRWEFALRSPYTFCFVHWFVGTCYMFHFALFVGMCRKILRKGVLWFIRDPDDPTFHPVRDVLERNVATQLRKIAFSALVYGALVILCLGGVIYTVGHVFDGLFPIQWLSTEPILEFPLDLFLYNFITPLIIRLFKPSDAVNVMYAWWLRRCARVLRLSHFLFDERRKDEEGHVVRKSWTSFLLMRGPDNEQMEGAEKSSPTADGEQPEVVFERDGKYVLTPCNDQYRPPKPGEAYLHADDDDVYIADKDGKKNEHFAKVYVPPLFRLRITLFMVCLWMFSAFTGLCTTLVPLIFGRRLFASIMPTGMPVNDIYAYSAGAYILAGVMFVLLKSRTGAQYVKEKAANVDLKSWIEPTRRFASRAAKCVYFYGFIGVVLPSIFALFLQFYVILPLHTWFVSAATSVAPEVLDGNGNATISALSFLTQETHLPPLAEHTIHILQDYALGLVYLRIAGRLIIAAPASRAAEAFRRITANGYLNPNVRLATRFFVLPTIFMTALVLLLPPLTVKIAVTGVNTFAPSLALDEESEVRLYRYSYPLAASCVVLVLGLAELGKATSRWRARIRDEVYLVGERLHNFGERKPPVGSKSVVRKER